MAVEERNTRPNQMPLGVNIGILASIVAGLFGAAVGGYVGWMLDDAIVILVAASFGFIILFLITFAVSGPGRYWYDKMMIANKIPDSARYTYTGFSTWDLYVTVHQIRNMMSPDGLFALLGDNNLDYVSLQCGHAQDGEVMLHQNPVKRTCIGVDHVFEECFHFKVAPGDDTIRFTLLIQDTFNDRSLGVCDVNISDQILAKAFPQHQALTLRSQGGETGSVSTDNFVGSLIVSFSAGKRFPKQAASHMASVEQLQVAHNQTVARKLQEGVSDYRTFIESQI